MVVLAGAPSVENFGSTSPIACGRTHQTKMPHGLMRMKFRHVEFRKEASSSFTDLFRKSSHLPPLRLLPNGPRSSLRQDPASNSSDDEFLLVEKSVSPESSSESPATPPSVPGDNQKGISNKKSGSNAAQSAFERAAAYKKLKKLGPSTLPQAGHSSSPPARPATDLPQVEIIRGQDVLSRSQAFILSASSPSDSSSSSPPTSPPVANVGSSSVDTPGSASQAGNPFDAEKTEAARSSNFEDGAGRQEPASLAAFERAKAYKQQQSEMVAALRGNESPSSPSEESDPSTSVSEKKVMEIEIITRDGVIKRKLMNPEEQIRAFSNTKDVKRKGVSGLDFVGLGFADKKSGRPAGLSESFAGPPTGSLPEVEIFTRDAGTSQPQREEQHGQDADQLYKPRVSTWGVFPRPADISKTYGGGRTIRPGEILETEEERKIRELRTQQLLTDYRKKMGLDVDPKIKAEAEQVLKRGDALMNNGWPRDALLLYELVCNKMPAQSELHGVAALQAAVCLDSLSRYDEARHVYERLLVHPVGRVSKQARRFLFGFKVKEEGWVLGNQNLSSGTENNMAVAMEKLKVDGGYKWDTSTYRKYFDSFADGYNTMYKAENTEETSENLLPYTLLLLFPILLVFALAISKNG